MKIQIRKTLSLLLAACLMFWMVPLIAMAANVSGYAALQAVCSASGSGDVTLAGDINGVTPLTIERDLTLDLNGHNLTIDLPEEIGQNFDGMIINTGVTLTVTDSNPGANSLTVTNWAYLAKAESVNGAGINAAGGTLIIQNGAVNATGGMGAAGIRGNGGNIIINGGDIAATGGIGDMFPLGDNRFTIFGSGAGISGYGGSVAINGGTVTARGGGANGGGPGINGDGGSVFISGGTVTAIGGKGGIRSGAGISGYGGSVTISGGMVAAIGGESGYICGAGIENYNGNTIITGGVVTAKGGNLAAGIGGGCGQDGGVTNISGGTVEAIAGGGDSSAIGRGGLAPGTLIIVEPGKEIVGEHKKDGTVNITGEYDHFLCNTTNSVTGAAGGIGIFTWSNTYKYIKLAEGFSLDGIEVNGGVTVTLFRELKSGETLIAAAYKGNKLIFTNSEPVFDNGKYIFNMDLSQADRVKVMAWGDFNTLQPLCPSLTKIRSGDGWADAPI